eukprot:1121185-Prymnesium_polylepis.3
MMNFGSVRSSTAMSPESPPLCACQCHTRIRCRNDAPLSRMIAPSLSLCQCGACAASIATLLCVREAVGRIVACGGCSLTS